MATAHKFFITAAFAATAFFTVSVQAEDAKNDDNSIDFSAKVAELKTYIDGLHVEEKIALLPEHAQKVFVDYPADLVAALFVGAGLSGYRKAKTFSKDSKFEKLIKMSQKQCVNTFKKTAKRNMLVGVGLMVGHGYYNYNVSPVQQDNGADDQESAGLDS